jgi:hypothetical protein
MVNDSLGDRTGGNKIETAYDKYMHRIGRSHSLFTPEKIADWGIRMCIGKTEDIEKLKAGACSHQSILERERNGENPENYCRKCGLNLNVDGIGRCNDYLWLRNPFCKGPICLECVKNGGDVFYLAFKKGSDRYMRLVNLGLISKWIEQVQADMEKINDK